MERSKEVKIPVLLLSAYYFFIPMDKTQFDHLRAYGVVYNTLRGGLKVEWILNYRGGSFLVEENKLTLQLLNTLGVTFEILPEEKVVELKSKAENSNMEFVILENPPKVAVYAPPYYEPWDDPVVMVLNYAQIPFTQIYDEEVLTGKLNEFDWVHLHHEDFTGQFGKFYASYGNTDWYRTQVTF
ncbi:MAG: asparagine synthetase B, partial [candidate division WOR-3 bacterium]